jgi:DNA ligase (NAD+)
MIVGKLNMSLKLDFINFNASELNENQLARIIHYHDTQYWKKGKPIIPDVRYDQLHRALNKLNPDHPLLHAVHGAAVAAAGTVKHEKPMLSLNKAYSLEDVLEWARKNGRENELLLIQPKYDGISANYDGVVLATRGDGINGENISDKLSLIELESTDYKGFINHPVRGEIVIRDDDFENLYSRITKKGGGHYKNSRNAVAGMMGLKDISDMLRQGAKLTLVDYEMICYRVELDDMEAKWPGILAEIEGLPYPMDGIVIKIADEAYSDSLGSTAHHPRGQIAFKFSGIRRQSKLLEVEWSFGKNCLTPVAKIEPVDVGGITIQHATLHNIQNIIDRDIHIGDTITVERAGDVIPYIVDSTPGTERKSCLIETCPNCHTDLVRRGPEVCCVNPDCSETQLQRLLGAVKSIGIERLGEPNIRRMMQDLNVHSLKDIFNLKYENILKLEGFKDLSANNLLQEIAAARTPTDYQIIAALNIPGIGPNVAKMLLTEYTIDELRLLDEEQLSAVNGIGPERATAIRTMLAEQSEYLDELIACVQVKQTKGGTVATAPTVCFTGKMPEKRSYYENMAQQRGFEPASSVTKELSLLVAADPTASGGKLKKAANLGVQVMALNEWLADNQEQKEEPVLENIPEEKSDDDDGQLFFNF